MDLEKATTTTTAATTATAATATAATTTKNNWDSKWKWKGNWSASRKSEIWKLSFYFETLTKKELRKKIEMKFMEKILKCNFRKTSWIWWYPITWRENQQTLEVKNVHFIQPKTFLIWWTYIFLILAEFFLGFVKG